MCFRELVIKQVLCLNVELEHQNLLIITRLWSTRSNPVDRINKKPDGRKNDQTTEKAKKQKTE